MTTYQATPEQWAHHEELPEPEYNACILELRARVEALEAAAHKHIVETSANILALASRVEALEAVKRPASKVYEISKPLKLTPEQAQQVRDLLAPNSKPTPNPSQIGRSLVRRVEDALMESVKEQGSMARAAIREVAAWLNENTGGDAAWMLTQEADR
jgi:uncharacterized membrane-anchored protein YjiN (DUF445 family)